MVYVRATGEGAYVVSQVLRPYENRRPDGLNRCKNKNGYRVTYEIANVAKKPVVLLKS